MKISTKPVLHVKDFVPLPLGLVDTIGHGRIEGYIETHTGSSLKSIFVKDGYFMSTILENHKRPSFVVPVIILEDDCEVQPDEIYISSFTNLAHGWSEDIELYKHIFISIRS